MNSPKREFTYAIVIIALGLLAALIVTVVQS